MGQPGANAMWDVFFEGWLGTTHLEPRVSTLVFLMMHRTPPHPTPTTKAGCSGLHE